MAERRMFSKTVLESDKFAELPLVSRMLYVNLNLAADDEGFVGSYKKIMQMMGARKHHLSALFEENYITVFPTGALVINHWHVHNKIPPSRKTPTQYVYERSLLELDRGLIYRLTEKAFELLGRI